MNDQGVLIGAADLLPALKARLAAEAGEILTFTDTEALRALEVITTRRPRLVFLERRFSSTARGIALANRIKADPSLADTQIRVVSEDGQTEAPPQPSGAAPAPAAPAPAPATPSVPPAVPAAAPAAPSVDVAPPPQLDFRGTRRAPRVRVTGLDLMIDGNRGSIVDLSLFGAQFVTASVLKPNQRVRVSLSDEEGTTRCAATVMWAAFEIPKGASPRYRVGVEFIDPDTAAIERYQQRHKAT